MQPINLQHIIDLFDQIDLFAPTFVDELIELGYPARWPCTLCNICNNHNQHCPSRPTCQTLAAEVRLRSNRRYPDDGYHSDDAWNEVD